MAIATKIEYGTDVPGIIDILAALTSWALSGLPEGSIQGPSIRYLTR